MTFETLVGRLEDDALERLRWLILREFRILPGSRAAKKLSDEACVICGAHMVLDCRLRAGDSGGEGGSNPAFDEKLFCELGEK
ncbi:MAG: hypothetical protein RSD32_02750 [Oscillospiraceae bacterium]